MQNQKKSRPKKTIVELHPWKKGWQNCPVPCLASWRDFFDNGLLLYSVSDHTTQCCTQKPFWVAKPEPQSFSASAFPYFEADAELGVYLIHRVMKHNKDLKFPSLLLRRGYIQKSFPFVANEPWEIERTIRQGWTRIIFSNFYWSKTCIFHSIASPIVRVTCQKLWLGTFTISSFFRCNDCIYHGHYCQRYCKSLHWLSLTDYCCY